MPKRYVVNGQAYVFPDDLDDNSVQTILAEQGVLKKEPETKTVTKPKATSSKVLEFLRPVLSTMATGAGTAAAAPFAGPAAPAVGIGAGIATDQLMQLFQGADREPSMASKMVPGVEQGGMMDRLASTGEQAAMNFVGGKAMQGLASGAKGVFTEFTKGGVVDPLLKDLGVTYSQYGNRPISEFIENIAARGSKALALQGVVENAKKLGTSIATRFSPARSAAQVNDPNLMAAEIQKTARSAFDASVKESDSFAQRVKDIAAANTMPVQTGTTQSLLFGANGSPVSSPVVDNIAGPVTMTRSIEWAKKFMDSKAKALTLPDDEKELLQAAKTLIDTSDAKFALDGRVVSSRPISFNDAWEFKKTAGALGYADPKSDLSKASSFFKDLERRLTDDIDSSVQVWPTGGGEAQLAWKRARDIVAQRNTVFKQGDSVQTLLNTQVTPLNAVNKVIDDPVQLERILNFGSVQGGTKALEKAGVKNFTSGNLKKDLQSYQFMRMMTGGFNSSPTAEAAAGSFSKRALLDQLDDPKNLASLERLYSKQNLNDIRNFFTAVGNSSGTLGNAGNVAAKIRLLGASAVLAPGIATAMLTGSAKSGTLASGVIVGGYLTLQQVGKLLTNPDTARRMQAFVTGAPLKESEQFAAKLLGSALAGTTMEVKMSDGTSKQVKLLPGGDYEVN